MRKFVLVLISLCILVIGISCASAADLDSKSVADDNGVDINVGNGDLNATELSTNPWTQPDPNIFLSESELESPSIISSERPWLESNHPPQYLEGNRDQRGVVGNHPPQYLGNHPPQYLGNVSPQYLESGRRGPRGIVDSLALGSGLGGGDDQNFYAALCSGLGGGGNSNFY